MTCCFLHARAYTARRRSRVSAALAGEKSAVSAFYPAFVFPHRNRSMRPPAGALVCCAGVAAFVGLIAVAPTRPFAVMPMRWAASTLRNYNSCPSPNLRVGLDPSRPLQFIHVPKAAGTTIQDVLTQSAYKRNVWFAMHDIYFETESLNCTSIARTASMVSFSPRLSYVYMATSEI